jgi:hypothetical protein
MLLWSNLASKLVCCIKHWLFIQCSRELAQYLRWICGALRHFCVAVMLFCGREERHVPVSHHAYPRVSVMWQALHDTTWPDYCITHIISELDEGQVFERYHTTLGLTVSTKIWWLITNSVLVIQITVKRGGNKAGMKYCYFWLYHIASYMSKYLVSINKLVPTRTESTGANLCRHKPFFPYMEDRMGLKQCSGRFRDKTGRWRQVQVDFAARGKT